MLLHGLMGQMHHWDVGARRRWAGIAGAIALELPILRARLARSLGRALAATCGASWTRSTSARGGRRQLAGRPRGARLALASPERVTGLVLTGSSGLFERGFTSGVPHVPTARWVREKMEEVFFDSALVTDGWVEEAHRMVTTRRLRAAGAPARPRRAKRDNLEERLGRIAVPTLLVWGRDDRITPLEVAERFRALIPDAQLVYLARCGHAPMLERRSGSRRWWPTGSSRPGAPRAGRARPGGVR